jgi:hypothetical protein
MAPVKLCATCHVLKDETEFYRRAKSPDGRQASCKDCDDGRHHMRHSIVIIERGPYRGVVGGMLIAGYVAPREHEVTP